MEHASGWLFKKKLAVTYPDACMSEDRLSFPEFIIRIFSKIIHNMALE